MHALGRVQGSSLVIISKLASLIIFCAQRLLLVLSNCILEPDIFFNCKLISLGSKTLTFLPTCFSKPSGILLLDINRSNIPSSYKIPCDSKTGLQGTSLPLMFRSHAIESN